MSAGGGIRRGDPVETDLRLFAGRRGAAGYRRGQKRCVSVFQFEGKRISLKPFGVGKVRENKMQFVIELAADGRNGECEKACGVAGPEGVGEILRHGFGGIAEAEPPEQSMIAQRFVFAGESGYGGENGDQRKKDSFHDISGRKRRLMFAITEYE